MTDPLQLERLISRAEAVLCRFEAALPEPPPQPDWENAIAFRWRKSQGRGWLQAIRHPHPIRLAELNNIDDQKERIVANTRQFVAGKPANNVLLTGTRGSGVHIKIAATAATPNKTRISNRFFLSSIPEAFPFAALLLLYSTEHTLFL